MTLRVLYGGTFDPVHAGHLGVARHARDVLDAEVALMPAADPPHKGPTRASAAQRAQMLQLAVEGEPGLRVDLRELQRTGPSYTVDTLQDLVLGALADAADAAQQLQAEKMGPLAGGLDMGGGPQLGM